MKKRTVSLYRLSFAAMLLALGFLLPFLTGQIPRLGQLLCPMHLPVLLCGFLCGWPYGLAVGVITPLLRSLLLGMPPLFPTALSMAVELGVYGLSSALLYGWLSRKKKLPALYLSLVGAMLVGRLAGGLVQLLLLGLGQISSYSLDMFLAAYVTGTLPGVLLQLLAIPPLVLLGERYLFKNGKLGS